MNLKNYVDSGVALLDEKMPGWHKRINLEELNIVHCSRCILGQLFGEVAEAKHVGPYHLGLRSLFRVNGKFTFQRAFQFGFSIEGINPHTDWDELRRAWIDAINVKLLEDEPVQAVEELELCEV